MNVKKRWNIGWNDAIKTCPQFLGFFCWQFSGKSLSKNVSFENYWLTLNLKNQSFSNQLWVIYASVIIITQLVVVCLLNIFYGNTINCWWKLELGCHIKSASEFDLGREIKRSKNKIWFGENSTPFYNPFSCKVIHT